MTEEWKLYQINVEDKSRPRFGEDEDGGFVDYTNIEGYEVGRRPQEAIDRFVSTHSLSDAQREMFRKAELVKVPDFRVKIELKS